MKIFISILFAFTSLFGSIERRAAFDIGSGRIKMQVSDVDTELHKILNVLYVDQIRIPLREDLTQNQGVLSEKILKDLLLSLLYLQEKASVFAPDAFFAIGTDTFRLAKNKNEVTAGIYNATKIPFQIISQEEEAILGFISALEGSHLDPHQVIIWDFGASSFQMITKSDDNFITYEGRLGKVSFYELLEKIGKEHAIDFVKRTVTEIPLELKAPNKSVLGIGIHPLWGMGYDKRPFSKEDLEKEISKRVDLREEGYVLSNLLLAAGIMEAFAIKEVTYVGKDSANAIGVLLTESFWRKECL